MGKGGGPLIGGSGWNIGGCAPIEKIIYHVHCTCKSVCVCVWRYLVVEVVACQEGTVEQQEQWEEEMEEECPHHLSI